MKIHITFDEMDNIYKPIHEIEESMMDHVLEEDGAVLPYIIITHPYEYTSNDLAVAEMKMKYLMKLVEETDFTDKRFMDLMNTKFYMTYTDEELSDFRRKVTDDICSYQDDEYIQLREIIKLIDTEIISRRMKE